MRQESKLELIMKSDRRGREFNSQSPEVPLFSPAAAPHDLKLQFEVQRKRLSFRNIQGIHNETAAASEFLRAERCGIGKEENDPLLHEGG